MLVSTTVVSTRILRPDTSFFSRANSTTRRCRSWTTAGPIRLAIFASTLASGTFSVPTRVNSRYTRLAPHLLLQRFKSPVPCVLENQQPQHYLRRCLFPSPCAAVLAALPLRLVYGLQQHFIIQQAIRFP